MVIHSAIKRRSPLAALTDIIRPTDAFIRGTVLARNPPRRWGVMVFCVILQRNDMVEFSEQSYSQVCK